MGTSEKTFNRLIELFKMRDLFVNPALWPIENIPLFGKLAGLLPKPPSLNIMNLSYIPVTENIEVPPGIAAPITIAETFIKEACHHVILNECICRATKICKKYPIDVGCIFMGEGAKDINPAYARHVDADEALGHFHKAVEAGLVPGMGRFIGDAMALGVKNHGRMMTMCLCCPCCCITEYLHDVPESFKGLVSNALIRLEGVSVTVNDNCNGCGACETNCPFGTIRVVDGKAQISENCFGCGRCAALCKKDAVDIRIDNPRYIDQALKRIRSVVNVG